MALTSGVAVTSPWDPSSPSAWSGVVLPMIVALRAEFDHVEFVPVTAGDAFLDRVHARLLGPSGRPHLSAWSPPTARRRSRALARALVHLPADLPLIAIAATPDLLDVSKARRVVQITDSSFSALANSYPAFRDLPAPAKQSAIRIEREVATRTEAFIVATQWSRDRLIEDVRVSPTRVHVARFGPAIARPPVPSTSRSTIDSGLRLLFVASDWTRKGGDLAVASVTELRRRGHDVRLTVVGDVPQQLPGHVVRTGRLDRAAMSEAYLTHDALLEPSRASAGGVVVTDALHHGLPVLASATGGLTDLVIDGETGWLVVDDGTPAPLVSAVEHRVLTSDRDQFSNAALRWARENADWTSWAHSIREVLESPSNEGPSGGSSDERD